jgi:hypothetical protein
MAASRNKVYEAARAKLLEEGAKSYLQAVAALIEFQKEVQKKCRHVLKKHINEYSAALKLKERLKDIEIKLFDLPRLKEWDGSWWILGAFVGRRNIIPGITYWEAQFALQYDADLGLFCYVGELYYPMKLAPCLHRSIYPMNRKVLAGGQEVWLPHALRVEEVATFEKPLESLFKAWIRIRTRTGGIRAALKV